MQISLLKNKWYLFLAVGIFFVLFTVVFLLYSGSFYEKTSVPIKVKTIFMSTSEYREKLLQETQIENPHVRDIISTCGVDEHCTVDSFQKLSKMEDTSTLLTAIDEYLTIFQGSEYDCHHMAHHIGEFMLAFSNGNITKALLLGSQKCGGALYHGIIENYLVSGTLLKKIGVDEMKITNLCDALNEDPTSQIRLECSHGFGHGLFKVYNLDINKSTKKCDEFQTSLEQDTCYKGIFMENQIQFVEYKEGVFDSEDVMFPCNTLDGEKASPCYYYQAFYILSQNKFSMEKGLQECDKILEDQFIRSCYKGIGLQGIGKQQNWTTFISLCETGQSQVAVYCVIGGAGYLADQFGIEKSLKFCGEVPEVFASDCFKIVGSYMHRMSDSLEEVKVRCAAIEKSEYVDVCENAGPDYGKILEISLTSS